MSIMIHHVIVKQLRSLVITFFFECSKIFIYDSMYKYVCLFRNLKVSEPFKI